MDGLLQDFIKETDEAKSSALLERIICEHAEPVVSQIIVARLRREIGDGSAQYRMNQIEDLRSEVITQLIKRVRDLKSRKELEPIHDFLGYAAVVAFNACHRYYRESNREHFALKQRIRHILDSRPELAIWQGKTKVWWCGFEQWHHSPPSPNVSTNSAVSLGVLLSQRESLSGSNTDILDLLVSIFNIAGRPIHLADLVDAVADTLYGRYRAGGPRRSEVGTESIEGVYKLDSDLASSSEQSQYLNRLWKEISLLSLYQRTALLLNLSDDRGDDMTGTFARLGVASIHEIAKTLAIPEKEFARMWPHLPLEDKVIAQRLGLTRQQVISLRQSARRRLSRRLK